FSCVVRRLRFSGPKTSIICSPMTSLKTSIKTITYLSDIGCLEIQGASLAMLFLIVTLTMALMQTLIPMVMVLSTPAMVSAQSVMTPTTMV
ncbi:hypothetical protein, partial [Salmonella enterica]|uniref:hypothetical protein n=1 Tax=Salmonella enterica TaxID=28901 RepID=UPI003A4C54ED